MEFEEHYTLRFVKNVPLEIIQNETMYVYTIKTPMIILYFLISKIKQ